MSKQPIGKNISFKNNNAEESIIIDKATYSQTSFKRSHLSQRKSGIIRQAIS